jgi:hypothetical protein
MNPESILPMFISGMPITGAITIMIVMTAVATTPAMMALERLNCFIHTSLWCGMCSCCFVFSQTNMFAQRLFRELTIEDKPVVDVGGWTHHNLSLQEHFSIPLSIKDSQVQPSLPGEGRDQGYHPVA